MFEYHCLKLVSECSELDDEKTKVTLLKTKSSIAKQKSKADAERIELEEKQRLAAMSAEEFKEHQFQLHAKAREAEKLAGSMNQMLEPLEHAERKQYRWLHSLLNSGCRGD